MTTIEMKLVQTTANYHLYKVSSNEERDSFGEIYVARREMPAPPEQVTVTVADSFTAAAWRAAEEMGRKTT